MAIEIPKNKWEIDMDELRSRVRSTLSAKSITVQNLSDQTGIPKSTLDGFLNRGTTPAFDTVALVCAALDLSVDSFLGVSSVPASAAEESTPAHVPEYADDLRESHLREIDALTAAHQRETTALTELYRRSLETLQQAHEAENAARDRHIAEIRRDRDSWRRIALVSLALFILIFSIWFIWDISHPDAGLILYDKRSLLSSLRLG